MNRTRAVDDAAKYGALFVRHGLLTHCQLDHALEAVSQGKNFEVHILEKEWVTEHEAACVREGTDPCCKKGNGSGNGRTDVAKQASVSFNRMEAHQDELSEAVDEFQSFGLSLLESVSVDDGHTPGSTDLMWSLPEGLMPAGIVGEDE